MQGIRVWMSQIRANFLILGVFLVALGLAYSVKYAPEAGREITSLDAILVMLGTVSAHIAVNLFNEYSDFRTGIDFNTPKTPFSGGSNILVKGKTTPREVFRVGVLTLVFAFAVGLYFSFRAHWVIMVLSLIGAFSILFYTNFLSKLMLGELFAGLTLGTMVVLGAYISMTATPGTPLSGLLPAEVVWISIPPGILTSLLLLINQFPDVEADRKGGRAHLVIRLGRKKASYLYVAGMFLTFGIIVIMPIIGISSPWIYLALIPMPLAIKASITALRYREDIQKLIPALANNVIVVLGTDLLLAVGVFIEAL